MRSDKWKQSITIYSFIICIIGMVVVFVVFPKEAVSKSERRRLAAKPAFTVENFLDESFMEDLEAYLLDHFPFRDKLRRIKAFFAYKVLGQKENNDIYVTGEHAAKLEYPLNDNSVVRLAGKMKALKAQYFPKEHTWYAIVPDKNYFLAGQNGYPAIDYSRMMELLQEQLGGSDADEAFSYIDIMTGLSIEDYYHTDTHWRQERLFATAGKIGEALGVGQYLHLDEAHYQYNEIEDFYGVYYGQAALPMEPDTIRYLTNAMTDAALVWNMEENMAADGSVLLPYEETAVRKPVYQLDKLEEEQSLDKYDIFLGGAASLQIIASPNASTDRRLIIFRDSYTSSLAPLLLDAYCEITLIDLRYISTERMADYVDFSNADILFLYNTSVVNRSSMLK